MSEEILYEVNEGVGRITFNRPEARNAFTFRMYERLAEICRGASADSSLRVLVLTGADETAFAAGTDISEFRKFSSPQDALDYEMRINALLNGLERIPIPTIAAVAGACTGGGTTIAACCDLRIGARSAIACRWQITRGSWLCSASRVRRKLSSPVASSTLPRLAPPAC
jgi:enoyl-CoA hydratase/carnithine racemase